MTYPMTDPQMKTKTMNMTKDKTRVQNCDVRAVSHSCDVLPLHSARYFIIITTIITNIIITIIIMA